MSVENKIPLLLPEERGPAEVSLARQIGRRVLRPQSYTGAIKRGGDVLRWRRITERIRRQAERLERDFTVVQIGANDGVHADPIRPFVERYGWRGVLVEPVPDHYERLRQTYATHTQLELVNCAISEADGTAIMYAARDLPNGLPNPLRGKDSFHHGTVIKHGLKVKDVRDFIEPIEVPTMCLETLLDRSGVDRIDFFAVDTEGHDAVIMSQLDFDRYRPSFVLYEHCHLEATDNRNIRTRLEDHGYDLTELRRDTFAELAA